jgi:putative sterol carrier protein
MQKPQTAKEILLSLPFRFRKEKSADADYHATAHFEISGDGGGEYTVIVSGDEIQIKEGLSGEPNFTVKTKDSVYADIEWDRENPQTAFLFGKVKVDNVMALMQFTGMFRSLKRAYEE